MSASAQWAQVVSPVRQGAASNSASGSITTISATAVQDSVSSAPDLGKSGHDPL